MLFTWLKHVDHPNILLHLDQCFPCVVHLNVKLSKQKLRVKSVKHSYSTVTLQLIYFCRWQTEQTSLAWTGPGWSTAILGKDEWRKDECKSPDLKTWCGIAGRFKPCCAVCGGRWCRSPRLWVDVGHTMKAARETDCHLAQFIPPFVYSSVVNAVCMFDFCRSLHTSALGILKSESTPHVWNIKQILLNMNKWINNPIQWIHSGNR